MSKLSNYAFPITIYKLLLGQRLATCHADTLARDIAGVLRCQEYIHGSKLRGLPGASHGSRLAELGDFVSRKGHRDERCPDWPRRYGIDAYPRLDRFLGQRFGKGQYGSLRGAVG